MEEKNIENMGKGGLWDTQQAANYLGISASFLNIDRVHPLPHLVFFTTQSYFFINGAWQ